MSNLSRVVSEDPTRC